MEPDRRTFLDDLLETPSPSGFETRGQRVWVDYVSRFADDVTVDEYGNAVAVYEGGDTDLLVSGHADEIGFIVSKITDDGYVKLGRIGGSDRTVTRGQHVEIHTAEGPVNGVIGQTAIHLRDRDDDGYDDIRDQHVDIGAANGDEAADLVEIGDPVTFATAVRDLQGTRIAGRGIDNRIGTWIAAETLRRAAEREAETTVYAASTVQEEVGIKGAQMVGYDVDPDVAVAVDVTHAVDDPGSPNNRGDVDLGAGPVVGRGSANHPVVVEAVRAAAQDAGIEVQLQASGSRTGTDADAFYTQRSGIPSLNVGIPNRYMHTPVEVVDLKDLDAAADLLAAFAGTAHGRDEFAVDV
ncbi:MAG: M20/M25/M40 family metallo-hydrolase [Halobacteriaceae archaeon]